LAKNKILQLFDWLKFFEGNSQRKKLPYDLTTDALIEVECDLPRRLTDFYSKLLSIKI
jgi:hypothetical protein